MEMLDEIVSEFLVESYESLDQLDRDLMALEETPDDRERMSSIFRTIHTIKGTAGFLAYPRLEKVAHVGESLLVPLRDGELTLTEQIANSLLAMVDAIRSILGHIENGAGEGNDEYVSLISDLERLKSAEESAPEADETLVPEAAAVPAPEVAEIPVQEVVKALSADSPAESQTPTSEAAVEPEPEVESILSRNRHLFRRLQQRDRLQAATAQLKRRRNHPDRLWQIPVFGLTCICSTN